MNTNLASTNTANLALTAKDIRAIRPPIDIPNFWIWLWIAIALLVLVTLAWIAWTRWRRKANEPIIIPPVPPHERARQKLEEALAIINQPQPFCILVSDTVRHYLEERFNFHAPDRTTEEFLYELQASELLLHDQKQSLINFLAICDMVKFARYEPGLPELQSMHASAVRLIDETEPQPEATTADPSTPPTA